MRAENHRLGHWNLKSSPRGFKGTTLGNHAWNHHLGHLGTQTLWALTDITTLGYSKPPAWALTWNQHVGHCHLRPPSWALKTTTLVTYTESSDRHCEDSKPPSSNFTLTLITLGTHTWNHHLGTQDHHLWESKWLPNLRRVKCLQWRRFRVKVLH